MAHDSPKQALDAQNAHSTSTSTSLLPEITQRPSLTPSVTSSEVVKEGIDCEGEVGEGGKENKGISAIDDDEKYLTGSTSTVPLSVSTKSSNGRYPRKLRLRTDSDPTSYFFLFFLQNASSSYSSLCYSQSCSLRLIRLSSVRLFRSSLPSKFPLLSAKPGD